MNKGKQGGGGVKTGYSWANILSECPLIYLAETHLLLSNDLSDIPTTHQIIRNDNEIDNFRSLAALYEKNKFTCLEQEMLILYSESNLQLHFVILIYLEC